jgi:hypothetical protein
MERKLVFSWMILLLMSTSMASVATVRGVLPPDGFQGDTTDVVSITGEVNNPMNLTLAELRTFPMVSEVAELKCVLGSPDVTYNWTGIPLFYLLTLAQIEPKAYKVAIHASDGFSSDLPIEDAMKPTTILAVGANGTDLPSISGIQGVFRLVVPGKWGYKWVGYVDQIQVLNYDYKGTYEGLGGFSDEANVSDPVVMSGITPPIEELSFDFGNRTLTTEVFTNATINGHTFDYEKQELSLNVSVLSGKMGFFDFKLQHDFLKRPYNVTVDAQPVTVVEGYLANQSYLWIALGEGSHTIGIVGANAEVPEFEPIPLILLFLTITLAAVFLFKKGDFEQGPENSIRPPTAFRKS